MNLFTKKRKPETSAPTPTPVFDYVAAEKAFLKQFQVQLTGSTLCVRKGGKFTPLQQEEAEKFLRAYLIKTGSVNTLWNKQLIENFISFVKAGQ